MRGQPGHNTQPHAQLQPSFQGIDAWITSKLNEALVCNLRVSLMSLADVFDMSSMVVCTTRHWQTSGRLVQELNVCTTGVKRVKYRTTVYMKCRRQCGYLIPAKIYLASARAWLYKHPWVTCTCQNISQAHQWPT